MSSDGTAGAAKLLADVVLGHAARFPSAIEMFEVLADEPGLGFVAENQVCIGYRPVAVEVPSLADLEVAAQFRRRVGPQGNGHHRIEEFFGLFKVNIDSRQIDKPELRKLPKQGQVNFQMVDKFREACLGPLQVGERHHRRERRRVFAEKHRELVDEVSNGGLRGLLAVVNLGGREVSRDLQLIAEIGEFFWFDFKVLALRMGQYKIEYSDAPLNVFKLMFPPVAKVLSADLAV